MCHLDDIGKKILLRHKHQGGFFGAVIVDVKDSSYVVEVESRARNLVDADDMLVDLEHEAWSWELWEKMF